MGGSNRTRHNYLQKRGGVWEWVGLFFFQVGGIGGGYEEVVELMQVAQREEVAKEKSKMQLERNIRQQEPKDPNTRSSELKNQGLPILESQQFFHLNLEAFLHFLVELVFFSSFENQICIKVEEVFLINDTTSS